MSAPDYLYDDGPGSVYGNRGRSRRGLLLGLGAGTVAVAVGAVVALPLLRGTPGEQVTQVADVFSRALAAGDEETAWGLLCSAEQDRLPPDEVAGDYLRPGVPTVGEPSEGEFEGRTARIVPVTWTDGDAAVTVRLTLVAEDGTRVCGRS